MQGAGSSVIALRNPKDELPDHEQACLSMDFKPSFSGQPSWKLGNGSKPRNYYTEPTGGLRISMPEGSFFFRWIRVIPVRKTLIASEAKPPPR